MKTKNYLSALLIIGSIAYSTAGMALNACDCMGASRTGYPIDNQTNDSLYFLYQPNDNSGAVYPGNSGKASSADNPWTIASNTSGGNGVCYKANDTGNSDDCSDLHAQINGTLTMLSSVGGSVLATWKVGVTTAGGSYHYPSLTIDTVSPSAAEKYSFNITNGAQLKITYKPSSQK
jgi:hypothetical protein